MRRQPRLVDLRAARQHRRHGGDADAAADGPGEVEEPGGVASSRIGTALSATVESGTNVKPMPSPWMKRGQHDVPVARLQRERGHQVHRVGVQRAARHDDPARVDAVEQHPGDRHRDQGGHAARRQHHPRQHGGVAHEDLREQRRQHHDPVERDADDEHGGRRHRERRVAQHPQVDHRLSASQLAHDQRDQRHRRHHPEPHDERRGEPVLALAAVEHELQRGHATTSSTRPGTSTRRTAGRSSWVGEEQPRQHHRGGPDRHVDVEHPAPAPVVGDPAAQRRPDDRREHDADAPDGHRHPALARRERLDHRRLRERHRAARRPAPAGTARGP